MKFMLMMHAPRGTGDYQITSWAPDDLKAHIGFMHQLNKDLVASGEFVLGEGLAPPGQAKLVRAGKTTKVPVTDGVFPEAKEFLAGFWMVDVDKPERAYEIAARISTAPGPAGVPLYLQVEVRQVLGAPPVVGDA